MDIRATLSVARAERIAARLEPEFFIHLIDIHDAIVLASSLQDDPLRRASCNLV